MPKNSEQTAHTRMIFMGESALADGFRLIGFETWADPPVKEVEQLVRELVNRRQNAFLVVGRQLGEADIPLLRQVREEGGHIVVTTVPPLNEPECFHCRIDERINRMLGSAGFGNPG